MTNFNFAALSNGQHLAFDPASDSLRFTLLSDQAGEVRLSVVGANLGVSYRGKTVWLDGVGLDSLTADNLFFANGGVVAVGDTLTGTRTDWYGLSYDLRGTTASHYIDGRGGADLVMTGSGDDCLVGNDALTGLVHVSRVGGVGSPTASYSPSISADGRFVGFQGGWTQFGSEDNSATDVFVKDLLIGNVQNEHKTLSGDFALSGSGMPVISADGNWLALWSNSDLTEESISVGASIYLADTRSGNVLGVSTNAAGTFANGASDAPDLTADGRFVVFESRATNLVGGNGRNALQDDIFLKDMVTGAVTRVSTSTIGGDANADCEGAAISAAGRYVVFSSAATNLTANRTGGGYSDVYLWDRNTGDLTNITGGRGGQFNARNADVAFDGALYQGKVVFETGKALVAGDTNNTTDVYAYDIASGNFERVSTDSAGGQANGASQDAVVSADGRFVAFRSYATDLVTGDTNGSADVFVKDLLTGGIALVSRGPNGLGNQAVGGNIGISAGGDWIVFESSASNLAATDDNGGLSDVFRVTNPLLIDTLRGGAGDDTYILSRADLVIEAAGAGTDTVRAGLSYALTGNVERLVLTGNGNLNGTGNGLANVLTGNGGANRLSGLGGSDQLIGGGGADVLIGGAGRDVMAAGADAQRDTFLFNARAESAVGAARDVIQGFDSGEDRIDLRGIDADTGLAGNQAFLRFSGTTARAHSAWLVDAGADIILKADVNGDTGADFEVRLTAINGIVASDLLL